MFVYIHAGTHEIGEYVSLPSLIEYITGVSDVPPMALSNLIEIGYYSNTAGNTLPGAAVCSKKVFSFLCHMTKHDFFSFQESS